MIVGLFLAIIIITRDNDGNTVAGQLVTGLVISVPRAVLVLLIWWVPIYANWGDGAFECSSRGTEEAGCGIWVRQIVALGDKRL